MTALPFCFVLHIHQPVGNFEHVFREHADDVYRPFLDFLERRDLFPIGLHVSGPLIEWLEAADTALLDRLGRLVSDGKLELLAAGWYEPILAGIPEPDRQTQLGWMRDGLRARFGVDATGLWLTERVWEPRLARDLADAGIRYALIDDHLARRGGVEGEALRRPIRVEHDGRSLDLLAIDEGLRYLIPFRPASEVEQDLRRRHEAGHRLALFGDDGEKFGGWPHTKEWLYDQGWLEAFGDAMDRLRGEGAVELVLPGAIPASLPASEPVDLPSGSYPEMDEWSGGNWKNFQRHYSESGRLSRRMTALSSLCRDLGDPEAVQRAIGRGQCNDAYWHGVFGGIYMKHLRQGVRRELARAEREMRRHQSLAWEPFDVDGRGSPGWWVHSDRFSGWVSSVGGGTVTELVHFGQDPDVTDTLTRRIEAYHLEAVARSESSGAASGGAPSIHETEAITTLETLPPRDLEDRRLVIDRVLPADLDPSAYALGEYTPLWTWPDAPVLGPRPGENALLWTCSGPGVEKTLRIDAAGVVEIDWAWDPDAFPDGALFAPEISLGRDVALAMDPPTGEVWTYAIVTVSKCPEGFEEIVQGTSVTPRWPVRSGQARLTLHGGGRLELPGVP